MQDRSNRAASTRATARRDTWTGGLPRRAFLGACGVLAGIGAAQAQDAWPARPIRLVVPFPPGGMTDLLGRMVADRLSTRYGQPVVVDNKPGAAGHLGAHLVAKAPPDGYTLLLGTIGIHAAYGSYRKLTYDPATELAPVSVLAESPNVVLVPASSPLRSFGEFLAQARAEPERLNYATAGPGSSTHMVIALFETMTGAKVHYVPYKGSGPAMVDLIGGQVQVMFENLPTGLPHIRAGKVRALAVTGPARDPRLPQVPTIAEAGLPGYAALSWFTLAAPAGTPEPLVERLAADTQAVLSVPQARAQLDALAANLVLTGPGPSREFIAAETTKWNRVIQAINLRLD